MNTVNQGGPVLTRAKIVLIFRGSGWTDGTPSQVDASNALAAILASPYMSQLVQYHGIRRAEIVKTITDATDLGSLGPDPRKYLKTNVWRISDDDIQGVVREAVGPRPPQNEEDTFYLIAISQDPLPVFSDELNDVGYHSQFQDGEHTLTYGAVLNWSANTAKNVWNSSGCLPAVLAHELVEACTDPDTSTGYRLDNGEELADLKDVRTVRLPGLPRDIGVAAYWSDLANAPVVPTAYSLRVSLGKRSTESVSSVRAAIQGTSVRNAILAGCNP
jgi:hypothetical protein